MNRLLTAQEYRELARKLVWPTQAYIDGRFTDAESGMRFASINPATGECLAEIAACAAENVDQAVAAARRSFEQGVWSGCKPSDRKNALLALAALMEQHGTELAVMESLDSGKPIRECQLTDIPEAIHTIRWHAELIDKIYDHTAPVGQDALAMVMREPIGVVGLVLPWNFPLLMLAWKIGPALAAGCSVIIKPAKETSLTALKIAELAHQAGIPAGVFNVLPGSGQTVGAAIGLHSDIDMVSFTGSTETGKRFLTYAAQSNLKRVVLECGGKNPAVVFDDIDDPAQVAQHIVNGAFWNMGENCSASSRLIVHRNVKETLLAHINHCLAHWPTGDPLDPDNRLGCLISPAHFDKVNAFIEQAKQQQATFVCGGQTEQEIYVYPTVIDEVQASDPLFQEEIFGPVLAVTVFDTFEEAIHLANDTVYGLTASVYGSNLSQTIRAARAIRAGVVTVNCFGEGDITTPFGGYRQSGFGGRDKSLWAHDQYTEIKTVWVDTTA